MLEIKNPPLKAKIKEEVKFRRRVRVYDKGLEHTIYKPAELIYEYECAYKMAHDKYVERDYMTPQSSGLRISLFNAVPSTTTFLGKMDDQIFIAGTLFPDSFLGLPFDVLYKEEAKMLRSQGRKIAEIGTIVSIINSTNSLMHLFKIMFVYAKNYFGIDDLVITINPKHVKFYEYILGFEQIGKKKNYPYVNNNPAVAYHLNLNKAEKFLYEKYPREPLEKDLHHFFYNKVSNSIIHPSCKGLNIGWSSAIYKHFSNKVDLFDKKNKRYFKTFDSFYRI